MAAPAATPATATTATEDGDGAGARMDRTSEAACRPCDLGMHRAFSREAFLAIEAETGRTFDFDACCADDGHNKLCAAYACPSSSFMQADVSGRNCWINPPHDSPTAFMQRYLDCKSQAPHATSACFVLPKVAWYRAPWLPLLRGMKLIRQYPAGAKVYTRADGSPTSTPWETQVWYDPPVATSEPRQLAEQSAATVCAAPPANVAPNAGEFQTQQAKAVMCTGRPPRTVKEQRAVSRQAAKKGKPPDLSMLFHARLCGRMGVTLVDTGASAAFLSLDYAQRAHLPIKSCDLQTVALADSQPIPVLGQVQVPMKLGSYEESVPAYVMHSLVGGVDLILGDAWLKRTGAVLDFRRMALRIRTQCGRRVTVRPMSPRGKCPTNR